VLNVLKKICFFALLVSAAATAEVDGLKLPTPALNVSLGIGFNYDYLKSPLDVNYDGAKGYYSVNIPIKFSPSQDLMNGLLADVSKNFSDGKQFSPNMAAKQFANTTIRVEVPMLWGVASFSYINVMTAKYENMTGIPNFRFAPYKSDDPVNLILSGEFNTPIRFSLGWESMTFGYVYRFDSLQIPLAVGLNLHRHRFYFNASGNVNIDALGSAEQKIGTVNLPVPFSYCLRNPIYGEYFLERWTPTFFTRFWNFDFISRIMFTDYAKGALSAKYAVPFFVNASNFMLTDSLSKSEYITDHIKNGDFSESRADTVKLETNHKMKWQMPSVLTLKYNIIPEHLSVSYSKFIGKTSFELVDTAFGDYKDGRKVGFLKNGLNLKTNVYVDHLILLNGQIKTFYGNFGIASVDIDFMDKKNLLGATRQFYDVPYGRGVMVPVLTGGGIIGIRLQFLMELDVLPFPALKTGLVYNF